jgi:predicted dienelactone hydrolase
MKLANSILAASVLRRSDPLVIPEPDTPYTVKFTPLELVDHLRPDPFNSTHARRIMVSRFSPIPREYCQSSCIIPWASAATAARLDDDMALSLNGTGLVWEAGHLARVHLTVCCEDKIRNNTETSFPLVLFSPGLMGPRTLYSGQAQSLAGLGYEVLLMDYPYETPFVEFPDGSVTRGMFSAQDFVIINNESISLNVELLIRLQSARVRDSSFILDTLDVYGNNKVIHIGHSFGGSTSGLAASVDPRIAGGVNIDGSIYGNSTNALDKPFLLFGSGVHNSTTDATWSTFINNTKSTYPEIWLKELLVAGTEHYSFTDAPLIVDALDIWEDASKKAAVKRLFGIVKGARLVNIMREYLSDFFSFVLRKSADEGLLKEPSVLYPEVIYPS